MDIHLEMMICMPGDDEVYRILLMEHNTVYTPWCDWNSNIVNRINLNECRKQGKKAPRGNISNARAF